MKKRRRLLLALLAAAVIAVVLSAVLARRHRLVLTGIVTTDDVIVSSEIGGRLQDFTAREGDAVTAGQKLAEIQPPEYAADLDYYQSAARQAQAQTVQAEADLKFEEGQTTAQIAQSEANLASAQAQAASADADLENADLAFRRAKDLRDKGTNSQQDYDQARTADDSARARAQSFHRQVTAAEAAVRLAQSNADQVAARKAALQAALDQAKGAAAQEDKARVRLGYTDIRSPVSGVIDVRAARNGEVVNPAQAIVTVIDPDNLWVRVDVEETYVDRIHLGDKYPVRLPSGAEREGTVIYRAVDADYATQRDVSRTKRDIRTFEIRLRCDNRDRALAVGMTAYVTMPLGAGS